MAEEQTRSQRDWWLVAALIAAALALGVAGFFEHSAEFSTQTLTWADALYRSLQLFTLESGAVEGPVPLTLEMARWLAPFTTVYAAVKGMLLLVRGKTSLLRLRAYRRHAVVCGLGRTGASLASGLLGRGYRVVVVDPSPTHSTLPELTRRGAVLLTRDARDPAALKRAGVGRASYVLATTGVDEVNVDVVKRTGKLNEERESSTRLCAFAHVSDHGLYEMFYTDPLFAEGTRDFDARLFSIYDRGARLVLEEFGPDRYRDINTRSSPPAHLAIVGTSPLAASLVLQAAHVCHYASDSPTRISWIGMDASGELERLKVAYPALDDVLVLSTYDTSPEKVTQLEAVGPHSDSQPVFYLCLREDRHAVPLARRLRIATGADAAPVVACLLQDSSLSALIDRGRTLREEGIEVFPLVERTASVEAVIGEQHDLIAKTIHQMYVEGMRRVGHSRKDTPYMVAWDHLPEEIRDSNRRQADHLGVKLRAAGHAAEEVIRATQPVTLSDGQIELLARMEHARWAAERKLAGWRYAPGRKDPIKKLNPLLVPYDQLPAAEQDKDRRAVTESLPRIVQLLQQQGTQ